jgi:hypothetical protein
MVLTGYLVQNEKLENSWRGEKFKKISRKQLDFCYRQSKKLQYRPKHSKYVVRQLHKFLKNTLSDNNILL